MESLEERILKLLATYSCPSCGSGLLCQNSGGAHAPEEAPTVSPAMFTFNPMHNRWLSEKPQVWSKPPQDSVPVTVVDLPRNRVVRSGVPLQDFKTAEQIPPRVLRRLSSSPRTVNLVRELHGQPRILPKQKKKKPPAPPTPPAPVEPPARVPKTIETTIVEVGGAHVLIGAPYSSKTQPSYSSYSVRRALLENMARPNCK